VETTSTEGMSTRIGLQQQKGRQQQKGQLQQQGRQQQKEIAGTPGPLETPCSSRKDRKDINSSSAGGNSRELSHSLL